MSWAVVACPTCSTRGECRRNAPAATLTFSRGSSDRGRGTSSACVVRVKAAREALGPGGADALQQFVDLLHSIGRGTRETYPACGGEHAIQVRHSAHHHHSTADDTATSDPGAAVCADDCVAAAAEPATAATAPCSPLPTRTLRQPPPPRPSPYHARPSPPPNPSSSTTPITQVPPELMLPPKSDGAPADLDDVIRFVYGSLASLNFSRMDDVIAYFKDRAILSVLNEDCLDANHRVLDLFPGAASVLKSADSVDDATDQDRCKFPVEFLNTLTLSSLPDHELRLKVNSVVILLRNIAPLHGLCNGTRLLLNHIGHRVLRCTILTGDFAGKPVMLPRITLSPSGTTFPFRLKRVQFPVKLAMAMSINKSQGQTLGVVGLWLPTPCFSHGHLYVALSRTGFPPSATAGVRCAVANVIGVQGIFDGHPHVFTHNIVYRDVVRGVVPTSL